ncbi:hypothetical protein IM792_11975 [Mucilaginibacter sp. JRF]|uniref:hypothetical protein n=1 Tax=Mucilaginibacter sp. JRF TaxID=2780088 RepID=UPI00187DFF8A|nr:hypothetical protein [Mucilaginibacter sp. JRF]MBE9585169.1 hypothetical protein [Mucilaginibacter sp. JRF]
MLAKGGLCIYLFQDAAMAREHHPEIRLETDAIDEVYKQIVASHPEFLHPNLKAVTLRPWGAKEFALMDCQLGVRLQQWS